MKYLLLLPFFLFMSNDKIENIDEPKLIANIAIYINEDNILNAEYTYLEQYFNNTEEIDYKMFEKFIMSREEESIINFVKQFKSWQDSLNNENVFKNLKRI